MALARVAEREQKLFGQAIRFTNKALALEPNDATRLPSRVRRWSSSARSRGPRKISPSCRNSARAAARSSPTLSAAISRGPTVAAAKPPAAPKTQLRPRAGCRSRATHKFVDAERFGAALRCRCQASPARRARPGQVLQARSQHLPALAERRRRQPLEHGRIDTLRASAAARCGPPPNHLGRRDERRAMDLHRDPRRRTAIGQHRQPAISLAAGRGDDPLGDLPLEHQGQRSPPGRPGAAEPAQRAAPFRHCRADWRRYGRHRRPRRARRS